MNIYKFFSQHLRSFSTVAFHNRIFTTCKCIHLAFVQTMHQRFFAASRFGPWETGTFETDVKFDRKKKSKTRGGKKRHIMSSTSSSKYQMSLTNVETVEFVLKYSWRHNLRELQFFSKKHHAFNVLKMVNLES